MADFKLNTPADLVERVRTGAYEPSDRVAVIASNFAYFLKPELRDAVLPGISELRNFGHDTDRERRQELVTGVLTGLMIAVQDIAVALEGYIEDPTGVYESLIRPR